MKNLDLGVREHSHSAATTSRIGPGSVRPALSRYETSVLRSFWCLDLVASRPQSNVRKGPGPGMQTLVSDARNGKKVAISLMQGNKKMLTTPWANMAKSRSTMSSLRGISKYCPNWLTDNNLIIPFTFSIPPLS